MIHNDTPLVSVIIPCYNIENKFDIFKTTLISVLNQTYKNFEIILVNDGSNDKTNELILSLTKSIKHINITCKTLENNSGPSTARNAGIQISRGELIAFLDYDDVFFPEYLEKTLECFHKNKQVDVVLNSAYYYISFLNSIKVIEYNNLEDLNYLSFEELVTYFIKDNFPFPMGSGIVCKKEIFKTIQFDEFLSKKTAEDVDFGYKILLNGFSIFVQHLPILIHRSYLKNLSRARDAILNCDESQVFEYIYNNSMLPLLKKIKDKINKSTIKEIDFILDLKKNVFKIKSMLFKDQYFQAISCTLNKPNLYKYLIYYLFIKLSQKNLFLHSVCNFYTFIRQKNNRASKQISINYLSDLEKL